MPGKAGKRHGRLNVDVSGAPPPWAGPVVKVLMVDDDQTMFLLVDRALSHHPEIQITYCNDIKEALAKARKLKPAIILQDLNMPGGDCLELLSQYRKDPVTRATPVIILSGTEDNDVKHKALALGANDYMVKSPNVQNIVDHVCHFAMS